MPGTVFSEHTSCVPAPYHLCVRMVGENRTWPARAICLCFLMVRFATLNPPYNIIVMANTLYPFD